MAVQEDLKLCEFCKNGYHAPFDRFERVASFSDGPTFLNRCTMCEALWHETLHSATLVSASKVVMLYPDASVQEVP
jgi:hypothetical protein